MSSSTAAAAAAAAAAAVSTTAHALKGISLDRVLAGRGRRIGIVHTQWNAEIIDSLRDAAVAELIRQGVDASDIVVQPVSCEQAAITRIAEEGAAIHTECATAPHLV